MKSTLSFSRNKSFWRFESLRQNLFFFHSFVIYILISKCKKYFKQQQKQLEAIFSLTSIGIPEENDFNFYHDKQTSHTQHCISTSRLRDVYRVRIWLNIKLVCVSQSLWSPFILRSYFSFLEFIYKHLCFTRQADFSTSFFWFMESND